MDLLLGSKEGRGQPPFSTIDQVDKKCKIKKDNLSLVTSEIARFSKLLSCFIFLDTEKSSYNISFQIHMVSDNSNSISSYSEYTISLETVTAVDTAHVTISMAEKGLW